MPLQVDTVHLCRTLRHAPKSGRRENDDLDWDFRALPDRAGGAGPTAGSGSTRPDALALGSGCDHDTANADLPVRPKALAEQLAQLPGSTVVQPVTNTQKLGDGAQHVRLRIADDCPADGGYRVAETPRGSRGISYSNVPTTVVMDVWVLNLDGVPVVVDTWYQDGASTALVEQITQASDSISFVG